MKFYKCHVCGKIIMMVNETPVDTICCGQKMEEMVGKTSEDGSQEKHVPIMKREDRKITVTVGEVPHPMIEPHHIEWIMICTDKGHQSKCLKTQKEPQTVFHLEPNEKLLTIYSYCNIHGLWKADICLKGKE